MNSNHFFIAGVQKCGTSTLYSSLVSHPEIAAAVDPETGQHIKEPHFFSQHWKKGFGWYASLFPPTSQHTVDATPNYISSPRAVSRMLRVFPRAKVIVSLRNPIARSISQHNHYSQILERSKNWDWRVPGEDFDTNVQAELKKPFPAWRGLLGRGCYAEQLQHLAQFFPRERIHVVIMEEWIDDPQTALSAMINFLELPPYDLSLVIRHQREHHVAGPSSETIEQLTDFFRLRNERLFDWLGRQVDQWSQTPRCVDRCSCPDSD